MKLIQLFDKIKKVLPKSFKKFLTPEKAHVANFKCKKRPLHLPIYLALPPLSPRLCSNGDLLNIYM